MDQSKIVPSRVFNAIKDTSLSNKAADAIRDMIIKGECPLGSRITETDLADALGVSRICIREAFLLLETEGLIRRVINKYTEIVRFTRQDVDEIYRLRSAVEWCCVETAMERGAYDLTTLREQVERIRAIDLSASKENVIDWVRADLNFHELLILMAGNERAMKIWNSLKNQIKTLLYKMLAKYPDSMHFDQSNSHEVLLKHIGSGNLSAAEETLKDHIMSGCRGVITFMSRNGELADE